MGNSSSSSSSSLNASSLVELNSLSQHNLATMAKDMKQFFDFMNVFDGWAPEGASEVPEDIEGALRLIDPHTTEVWKNYTKVVDMYSGGERERIQKRLKKVGSRLFVLKPYDLPSNDVPRLFEKVNRILAGAAFFLAGVIVEISGMQPGSSEARDALLTLYQAYNHNKLGNSLDETSDMHTRATSVLFAPTHKKVMHSLVAVGQYLTVMSAMSVNTAIASKPEDGKTELETQLDAFNPHYDALCVALDTPEGLQNLKELHQPLADFKKFADESKMRCTGAELEADAIPVEEHMEVRQAFMALLGYRVPIELVDRAFGGEEIPASEFPALPEAPRILSSSPHTNKFKLNEGVSLQAKWTVTMREFFGVEKDFDVIVWVDAEGGHLVKVEPHDKNGIVAASPSHVPGVSRRQKEATSYERRIEALKKSKKIIKEKKHKHYGRLRAHGPYRQAHANVLYALVFGTFGELEEALRKKTDAATAYLVRQPRSAEGPMAYRKSVFLGQSASQPRRRGPPPGMGMGPFSSGMPLPPELLAMLMQQQQ